MTTRTNTANREPPAIVLSPGVSLTPLLISHDEMAFFRSGERMRDEALALFGVLWAKKTRRRRTHTEDRLP